MCCYGMTGPQTLYVILGHLPYAQSILCAHAALLKKFSIVPRLRVHIDRGSELGSSSLFSWEGKYEIMESNAAAVFHQILYMS